MSFNELFYNSVDILVVNGKITVVPNFLCPKCNERPQAKIKSYETTISGTTETKGYLLNPYVLPCCGTKIDLYTAVYRSKDAKLQTVRISRTPIPPEWWKDLQVVSP